MQSRCSYCLTSNQDHLMYQVVLGAHPHSYIEENVFSMVKPTPPSLGSHHTSIRT